MHHPTFCKQDYDCADGSRNLASGHLGKAWRNTYHAFPTFSRHGADGGQIDLSAQFIELIEKLRRARKTSSAVS